MEKVSELKWILRQCKGSFVYLFGLLCLNLFVSVCYILITLIFQGFMNIAAGDTSVTLVQMFCFSGIAVLIYALSQIFSSLLEGYIYGRFEKNIRGNLIEEIFDKQSLDIHRMHSGEILNRLTSDVANVVDFVVQLFGGLWLTFFTALLAIIYLFILNWKMAVLYLTIIPLLFLAITRFAPKIQVAAQADAVNEDNNRKQMQEILNRFDLFQIYSMKDVTRENWEELYKKKKRSKIKLSLLQGEFGFLNTMMTFAIFLLSSGIGAYFVINGSNKVGDLVAMIQLSNYIILPLTEGSQWMSKYNNTVVSVRRINELESFKNKIKLKEDDLIHEKIEGLVINDLSFSYVDDKQYVLEGVSADFPRGEIVGIVGASGSGKTTLLNLILGLFPAEEESMICAVSCNGKFPFAGGRQNISYVPSDNFVFYGSVKENICMSLGYDEKKFWEVCKLANIDRLIDSFKEKEKELINENGNNLSEGQKQRIALARALYNDADIIVFDEPTANLDKDSCNIFMEMLRVISIDRICIIVTHDNNMTKICDKIYELKDKKLVPVPLGGQADRRR